MFLSLTRKAIKAPLVLFKPVEKWLRKHAGDEAKRRRKAQRLASSMLSEFSRLGFTRKVGTKKNVKRQRVRFEYPLLMTREELWCPIDLKKLPTGIRTADIQEETVLQSMEDRLNHGVRVAFTATGKLCFVVKLAGAQFPEKFPVGKMQLPADAPALALPLGMCGDGEQGWVDLAKLPHLLVVGPTNKGKSTLIHAMLTTWISRNSSTDLHIWLADHKGGVELNRYKELQATRNKPGIIKNLSYKPEDTIFFLADALKETERRLETLRRHDASDIDDLAKMTGIHLPRIAVVIDEIFFLMLNKEKIDPGIGTAQAKRGGYTIRDWAEQLFAKIASSSRAAGIHLVIATQKTGKDVLTSLITANFETRLVFGCASMYDSIYVLGDSSAVGLPRGRVIFRREGGEMDEYQTCWISPDQTRLIINRIAKFGPDGGLGNADAARRMRDDSKLLVSVACNYFEGAFSIRSMYQHDQIRGSITKDRVEELAQRLERDGVLEPGGPRKPRRVARAFFNRVELLDLMYGPQSDQRPGQAADDTGQGQDVDDSAEYDRERGDTSEAQQQAGNVGLQADDERPDTSYDRADLPDHGEIENAGDEPELSGNIDSFLQRLEEPKPDAKPKRNAKPRD
jgi:DNA segregation ATPase FtsK/SpoIIIE-like protein